MELINIIAFFVIILLYAYIVHKGGGPTIFTYFDPGTVEWWKWKKKKKK
jgi:hypothetical protein